MKFRLLVCVGTALALCGGLIAWSKHREVQSRRWEAWHTRNLNERVLVSLERPFASAGQTITIGELADLVSRQTGIEVEIDQTALADTGIKPTQTVTLPAGMLSAKSLLHHAIWRNELDFEVRGGRLHITTPERAQTTLLVEVYPTPQPSLVTGHCDEDDWLELITCTVAPDSWDEVGGPGYIRSVPGAILVVQTREVHEQIRDLFGRLGELENPPRDQSPVPLAPMPLPTAFERLIYEALEDNASIEALETPLGDLVAALAARHKVPIELHAKRLEEAGVGLDTPVTASMHEIRLKLLLRHLLNELELTYMVRDEVILISTSEDAQSQLETVAYPVHELVASPSGPDFEPLIDLMTSTVAPDSWDEVGGPGSTRGIAGGWLLLSQTQEVHEEVADLLANLRLALRAGEARPYPIATRSPAELRIDEALNQDFDLCYFRTPLDAVCRDLSSRLGIAVCLNRKRLEECGINSDLPINCSFPKAPLRVQLDQLCEALELAHSVEGDVLSLTTPEHVDCWLPIRMYDARPLLDPDFGLAGIDELIDLVTGTVRPDSWDQVGGPGAIQEYRGLLVIAQTESVHRHIEGLLAQLETHCLPRATPSAGNSQSAQRIAVCVPPDSYEQRTELSLLRPMDADFCGVALEDAIRSLASQTGLPITLDRRAMDDEGIHPRVSVSLATCQTTLAGVLDRLLVPLDMHYEVRNRQLVITPSERRASSDLQTRLYPVADLAPGGADDMQCFREYLLADLEPERWEDAGGPASCHCVRTGWLVVTGTLATHLAVADWLQEQRTGKKTQRAVEREELREAMQAGDYHAREIAEELPPPLARNDWPVEKLLLSGASHVSIAPGEPDSEPREYAGDPFGDPFSPPAAQPTKKPAAEPDPFVDPFAGPPADPFAAP